MTISDLDLYIVTTIKALTECHKTLNPYHIDF